MSKNSNGAKKATIGMAIFAVIFGIILGLSQAEDKRYSYKA